MEERDGGFLFFCSQKCLEQSQRGGEQGEGVGQAVCDACAKRFTPDLVSQVLYVAGKRHYACSLDCRAQLVREAKGARLGDIAVSVADPLSGQVADGRPAPGRPAPIGAVVTRPAVDSRPERAVPSRAAAVPVTDAHHNAAPAPTRSEGVPRYLAVFNHKGGTGKTTTAVTVAAGIAARGKRVLLVDTDAQGNVAVSLGVPVERSLYHVIVMGLRVSDAVRTVRPNLDLLPSNETLAAAELYLAGRNNRDRVLQSRLASAATAYDFVVLDCSPSLSLMNQNALVFADSVLVPVCCDYLSLVGVRQVIKTVKNVNALLHHPVQIWGVLPTFYDARAKICREAITTLASHFGDRCLSPIRAAIKVKEAPAQGQTLFEYARESNAAEDYAKVVETILASRDRTEAGLGVGTVGERRSADALPEGEGDGEADGDDEQALDGTGMETAADRERERERALRPVATA
jgi:chromosome partitioning protein